MVTRQRRLTGLQEADQVEVTIGRVDGQRRPAGETSVVPTYTKITDVPCSFTKRSSAWTQHNYGREEAEMYTVIPQDDTVQIDVGDVVRVTSSDQSPDPAVNDHFLVEGSYYYRGKVRQVDVVFHEDFTQGRELSEPFSTEFSTEFA